MKTVSLDDFRYLKWENRLLSILILSLYQSQCAVIETAWKIRSDWYKHIIDSVCQTLPQWCLLGINVTVGAMSYYNIYLFNITTFWRTLKDRGVYTNTCCLPIYCCYNFLHHQFVFITIVYWVIIFINVWCINSYNFLIQDKLIM